LATPCRVFLAFSGYKRKVLLRREREATEATVEAAKVAAAEAHTAVGIDSERPVLSKDIASADGLWPVAPKHLEDIMDKFQSQRQAVLADLRSRLPLENNLPPDSEEAMEVAAMRSTLASLSRNFPRNYAWKKAMHLQAKIDLEEEVTEETKCATLKVFNSTLKNHDYNLELVSESFVFFNIHESRSAINWHWAVGKVFY